MSSIGPLATRFLRDQRGATVIEYGLVATLISITIITWAAQIGGTVTGFFESMSAGFNGG